MTTSLSEHVRKRIDVAAKYPQRRSAKVTIELLTPLHVGAGDEGEISDAAVVLDANGLATLPGSSIKGVLRSAFLRSLDQNDALAGALEKLAEELKVPKPKPPRKEGERPPDPRLRLVAPIFGYQDGQRGRGSRVRVTWGRVHDRHNRPVEGILAPGTIANDPVLESASNPELRDHVRIDGRGISDKAGKFDDLSVPAGHRFTFNIEFVSNDDDTDTQVWATLLGILHHAEANPGHLRFGGKTRRGFGAVKVVSLVPDPDEPSVSLETTREPLHEVDLVPGDDCFWMFGGGDDIREDDNAAESDSNPVRAGKVFWDGDTATFDPAVLVIPGSALKGPLRHRTRFHLCRHMGVWAENAPEPGHPDQKRVDVALSLLFGDVDLENKEGAPDRKSPKDRVRAGCLYIDDIYLDGREGAPPAPETTDLQNHVTIDRALGGAQDHHLFTDRPLHGGGFTLHIDFEPPRNLRLSQRELEILGHSDNPDDQDPHKLLDHAKAALNDAVEDLKNGLLALGAHGNRGYGWFRAAGSSQSN